MVEGGMSCIKYLLFAFNFIFFIIGLTLIICGAVVQGAFKEYFEFIGGDFSAAAVLLLVVGIIIFVIGFFGCCGAVKENQCMVMTFSILLAIILILEVVAGIVAFHMQAETEELVARSMTKSLDNYKTANGTRKGWDALQQKLECCGVNSTADWEGKVGGGLKYPKSCCKKEDFAKDKCGTDPKLAYDNSCMEEMKNYIESNIHWIGVVGICMSLIQIIGIVFACLLARSISKEYQSV